MQGGFPCTSFLYRDFGTWYQNCTKIAGFWMNIYGISYWLGERCTSISWLCKTFSGCSHWTYKRSWMIKHGIVQGEIRVGNTMPKWFVSTYAWGGWYSSQSYVLSTWHNNLCIRWRNIWWAANIDSPTYYVHNLVKRTTVLSQIMTGGHWALLDIQ